MKLLKNSSYFQSLLVLMTLLITFLPSEGVCDTFSDDFETTNLNWRQVGTSSGTFSTDVGSGGAGTSVRLVDTDTGFHSPKLAVNNAQYYNLSSAVVQAEVLPNSSTGGGGVGFGVYNDNGSDVCAGVVAVLGYANSSWYLIISDQNEYESEFHTIAITPVTIDPNQFHLIRLESSGGNLTATLTLDDASTISISGPQRLNIDVAGIGLIAQNGDFSFDNFYMNANPDDRHMVFDKVELITESSSLDVAFPAWSHDGKKVAYLERDDVNPTSFNVWVKQIDPPTPAYKCTENSNNANLFGMPSFSPDNNYVLFDARNPSDYNRMEIKRAMVRNDDSDPISVDTLFSQSGKSFWLSEVALPKNYPNILIGTTSDHAPIAARNLFCVEINDDGSINGSVKMLTGFSATGSYTGPFVASLDNMNGRLAFSKMLSGTNSDLYVINDAIKIIKGETLPATDGDPRMVLIAEGANWQTMCKFSGDGSLVYYTEDVNGAYNFQYMDMNRSLPFSITFSGAHFEIFAVNPDALDERIKINYYRPYSQGILDASPDGTKLIFCSDNQDDGDGQEDVDLYMVTLKVEEEIIASEGGQIADGSGTALDIPANSLTEDTSITITTPVPGDIPSPATLPEGMQNIAFARMIDAESDTVEFDPGNPPILTIQYTDEEIAGLDEQSLQIFVYNEDIAAWEAICGEGSLPVCTRNAESNTISAPLPHLSMFCLSGHSDADSDGDGTPDYNDGCPSDPAKTDPGACGCGVADTDADNDGFMQCVDCNDNDASVKPGAVELCDGKDNDCDGMIDEGIYVFGGFQQPINPDGSSIFKLGRTIPVKIIIADCSGAPISTATVSIAVYKISGSIMGTEEEFVVEASGSANTGNLFRYDDSAGQYIFNLGTKNLTKGTYKIYAVPDKGERYSVIFSLK